MEIIKNLLDNDTLAIVQGLLSKSFWGFGYTSTDINKPIWNFDKEKGKEIAVMVSKKLPQFELVDWHINGQTYMLHGSPHTDAYCTHAAVWFPNEWEFIWGGRLHIFTQQGIQIITPEKNMAVVFDSKMMHYAEAPVVPKLRVSVGLKLNKKD